MAETVAIQSVAELRTAIEMLECRDPTALFQNAAFQSAMAGGEQFKAVLDAFMPSPPAMYDAARKFIRSSGAPAAAYAAALRTIALLQSSGYDGVPVRSLSNGVIHFTEPSLALLACEAIPSTASAVHYIHAFFDNDAVVDRACDILLTVAEHSIGSAVFVRAGALNALARAYDRCAIKASTPMSFLARFIKCFNRGLKPGEDVAAARSVLLAMNTPTTTLQVLGKEGITDDVAFAAVKLLTLLKTASRQGYIAVVVCEEMARRKADGNFVSAACACLKAHLKLELDILVVDNDYGRRFSRALLQTFAAVEYDMDAICKVASVIRRVAQSSCSSSARMQLFVDDAVHFGVITKLVVLLRRVSSADYIVASWHVTLIKTLAAIAKQNKQRAVVVAGGVEVLMGLPRDGAYRAHAVCNALRILTENEAACALVAKLGGIRVLGEAYAAYGDSKSHNVFESVHAAMANIEAWRRKFDS